MNKNTKPYTDVNFIAALLSYGFEQSGVDRTEVYRQRFFFLDETRVVFILNGTEVSIQEVDLDTMESKFLSKQLMLLPSYPDVWKSVKYSIHSHKNDNK